MVAGYCKGNVLAQGGKWPPNNWSGLKVAMNQAQLLNGNKWGDTKEVRIFTGLGHCERGTCPCTIGVSRCTDTWSVQHV